MSQNGRDRVIRVVEKPRSGRDLRSEILSLASALVGNAEIGTLRVLDPLIATVKIQGEWEQALAVLDPDIRRRMVLDNPGRERKESSRGDYLISNLFAPIERPNYRFEVLRLLIEAAAHDKPLSMQKLVAMIGVSKTPIQSALSLLTESGLVMKMSRGNYTMQPAGISQEVLGRLQAYPQTLRFRFGRGATTRKAKDLFDRAQQLMGGGEAPYWDKDIYLSGVAAAQASGHSIDLLGLPRLDLVLHVWSAKQALNTSFMRTLDDGLELEPSPLEPASVVVTLVHGHRVHDDEASHRIRMASPGDIFLSMIDLGLKGQALEYLKGFAE